MLHVGLTGSIASGKSTVARLLAARGAVVLDADAYARTAVAPGSRGLAAVVARFGPAVLQTDGALDRAALGRVVFRDPAARRDLEAIVHPEVARLRAADLADARRQGARVVVSDIPLLFEAGLDRAVDFVVVVDAPEAARLGRLVRDRALTIDDARARFAAQGDPDDKRARADVVIENSTSPEELERQVDALWQQLTARAATHP